MSLIASSGRELSIAEIAAQTGLNESGAYRLLRTLEAQGFVSRQSRERRYGTGPRLVALAATVMQNLSLRAVGRPHLESLRDLTSETVSLHVRVGQHRVCVDSVEGIHAIRRVIAVGETVPMYAGPTGKVMLAFVPAPERAAILAWAGSSGQDVTRIREMVDAAGRDGYLIDVGDRTPGVAALSVPVFAGDGSMGAITISGPENRWTPETMRGFVNDAREAAKTMSTSLGAQATDSAHGRVPGASEAVA
jgi:DNA-binding IclR family transcriptional regulator